MRILITGATGFIGRVVVDKLVDSPHQLRCLVRPHSRTEGLPPGRLELVTGDVTNLDEVRLALRDCECVIHLANIYSFWEADPSIYTRVNVEGTRHVMQGALEAGVRKVIHVSTCVVYGQPADSPFVEESTPGPVRFSRYAESKYAGDRIAWEYYREHHLPLVVLYPAAVLGPGDPKSTGRYIQNLVHRRMPIRGFEKTRFTFVYVGDVAEGIIRALMDEDNAGRQYLLGRYSLTYAELNRLISESGNVPLPRLVLPDRVILWLSRLLTLVADRRRIPPRWGLALDQMRTLSHDCWFDGRKAERELGLSYTSLKQAVQESVASALKEDRL